MNADRRLTGLSILVTRPRHQADKFCSMIEAAGGEAIRFPTLEIQSLDESGNKISEPEYLARFDWLLFISANAVHFAVKACDNALYVPARLKVAAIGQATAEALKRSGVRVDLFPRDRFNTEAFLEVPEMQSVAGQRILIVRGRGGRELLGDTLRIRGAHVIYAEVYQRVRPNVAIEPHLKAWRSRGIDAVTIFSGESLKNFVVLLGDSGMAWAREIPLIVVGERVAAMAEKEGFKKIILAANATDSALFEVLEVISDRSPDRVLNSESMN